jgi:glutamate N-acetyltransferase/amino-acid N-acetyltransferase
VSVFLLDPGSSVGGVFTTNRFCAAPVQICQHNLAQGAAIRAMVINTGNANAGTGADGLARARATCDALSERLGITAEQVLPFSTGVIMEPLPSERIIAALDRAIATARVDAWMDAAEGIMTTDTVPKAFGQQVQVGGSTVSVTGISKGAGMIRPNMATMLGFIATDACVHPDLMQPLALALAQQSFNCVTVDGDTSTNDSLVVVATHQAGHARIDSLGSPEGQALFGALLADFSQVRLVKVVQGAATLTLVRKPYALALYRTAPHGFKPAQAAILRPITSSR